MVSVQISLMFEFSFMSYFIAATVTSHDGEVCLITPQDVDQIDPMCILGRIHEKNCQFREEAVRQKRELLNPIFQHIFCDLANHIYVMIYSTKCRLAADIDQKVRIPREDRSLHDSRDPASFPNRTDRGKMINDVDSRLT